MSIVSLTQWEDDAGTCNPCPGELGPAEALQCEPASVPPPVPWRALGAGCAVLLMVPLVAHLVLRALPYVAQVAAR